MVMALLIATLILLFGTTLWAASLLKEEQLSHQPPIGESDQEDLKTFLRSRGVQL